MPPRLDIHSLNLSLIFTFKSAIFHLRDVVARRQLAVALESITFLDPSVHMRKDSLSLQTATSTHTYVELVPNGSKQDLNINKEVEIKSTDWRLLTNILII